MPYREDDTPKATVAWATEQVVEEPSLIRELQELREQVLVLSKRVGELETLVAVLRKDTTPDAINRALGAQLRQGR